MYFLNDTNICSFNLIKLLFTQIHVQVFMAGWKITTAAKFSSKIS